MSQELPLVSVLTTVKNGAKSISSTIDSVINQNYLNIEYIVIDGGSTDNTVAVIKETVNSRVQVISEIDNGVYYGMNNAISKAKGDIIAILNCGDCFIDNGVIGKVVDLYNKTNNKITVFNGGIRLVDNNGRTLADIVRTKSIMRLKYFIMPINHPAFFVTKEVYEKYGTFNTNFRVAADYELVLRLSKKNVQFCFFPYLCTAVAPLGISSYSENTKMILKEGYNVRALYIPPFLNISIDYLLAVILALGSLKDKIKEYLNYNKT
jgi:glycosyltransferase involved in cell wall biosynthesis